MFAGLEHKSSLLQMDTKAVDPSDFDCILCCRTLWRPVTTPCGHSYCARCLERCLDYSSSCPLCMTSLINVSFIHFYASAATTECSSRLELDLMFRFSLKISNISKTSTLYATGTRYVLHQL